MEKQRKKLPILFHGTPLPADWTAEKAAAQVLAVSGSIFSGKEMAEKAGLTGRKDVPAPEKPLDGPGSLN